MPLLFLTLVAFLAVSCARENPTNAPDTTARSVLLITVDTLRADRVGAYGYGRARTPVMDSLAARGARFTHAFAPAPITLTSHASLMTGRYPPGHGARHNGMRLAPDAVTLAESLSQAGMATGAFVGAFPLDRRFGLDQGFTAYGDTLPRGPGGRVQNERAGRLVVDEALAWLATARPQRFFLWVHLFEPHAPYGNPADARPARDRYDDEVAEVDRQIGRVIGALGDTAASTLVIVTADHGEAFGEHGEIGHSIFVYDTTLRIPLIVAGPSVKPGVVDTPVSLVDLAPTIARRLNTSAFDADGVDLSPALEGGTIGSRPLYAESFAPLLDFGWSPLRSLRADGYKYIAAPKPELYALENDPGEHENLVAREAARAAVMQDRVQRISSARLPQPRLLDADAAARLQALGYASGGPDDDGRALADPKDRRDLAARIAQVTSGELSGAALETTLRSILAEDPRNPQAHLRLGYVLHDTGRCPAAEPHFRAAVAAQLPGTDAHLGLAACRVVAQRPADAVAILTEAAGIEPGNPVVLANLGGVLSDSGQPRRAVEPLRKALSLDPDLHQGRFMLAIALARAGDRAAAARETQELLRRLPADAPQRAEVERLQSALQ